MRMRRKKHGAERIAACSELLIEHPELLMQDPCAPFSEKKPLALEIGCGNSRGQHDRHGARGGRGVSGS